MLARSLVAATHIERYGRSWRLDVDLDFNEERQLWRGRIGYQTDLGSTEQWVSDKEGFREQAIRGGQTSPFVVSISDRVVAFQTRGQDIKARSFTGAFQALLDEGGQVEGWEVSALTFEDEWSGFVQRSDKVTKVRFTLLPPNPDYHGSDKVEDAIEAVGTEKTIVEFLAADGLDLDNLAGDSLYSQALEHAVERGYGNLTAIGEVDGRRVTYDAHKGETPPLAATEQVGEDGEVVWTALEVEATGDTVTPLSENDGDATTAPDSDDQV